MTIGRNNSVAGSLPVGEPGFQPAGATPCAWPPLASNHWPPITDYRSLLTGHCSPAAHPSPPAHRRSPLLFRLLPVLVAAALFITGCASPNVNPPQPRAHTGYVDIHADSTNELCWEVARFDEPKAAFQLVISEFKPPQAGILRLAFVPGRHRLRISFLNLVVVKPAEVEVEVEDGKITPVRVTLAEAGMTLVQTTETSVGGTAYGRYGRRTKVGSEEAIMFQVSALAEPPIPYQVKELTSYAR
jgi:hypothetical protein